MPGGVTVDIQNNQVVVKSPQGEISFRRPKSHDKAAAAGTERSLINNATIGLTQGFTKTLEIQGTGFKAVAKDKGLELSLGFSHLVNFTPPAGITLTVKDNRLIVVTGIDKYLVGQTAANLRALKPPDVYKGKGIRYLGEIIKLKPGKAAKAAEA